MLGTARGAGDAAAFVAAARPGQLHLRNPQFRADLETVTPAIVQQAVPQLQRAVVAEAVAADHQRPVRHRSGLAACSTSEAHAGAERRPVLADGELPHSVADLWDCYLVALPGRAPPPLYRAAGSLVDRGCWRRRAPGSWHLSAAAAPRPLPCRRPAAADRPGCRRRRSRAAAARPGQRAP